MARFFPDPDHQVWFTPPGGEPINLSAHILRVDAELKKETQVSRVDVLRRQLAVIADELDRLSARPPEPVAGTVIRFTMDFNGSREYDYAAIRAGDGLWYTTGPRSPKGYTWDQLLDWMEGNTTGFNVLTPKKSGRVVLGG